VVAVSVATAWLMAPLRAEAQVVLDEVFYAVAFTHGTPHTGVITAQRRVAPFEVLASAERGTTNGAISLDPLRGILYGGQCCNPNLPLQAYDARTLLRAMDRDIPLSGSGSISIAVDGPRRILFVYDTVQRSLRALSLAEGTGYGTVLATTPMADLPAEPTPTSVGDQLAVDARGQQVFLTGGDGGPVVSVDVSGLSVAGGTFGVTRLTGQTNRRSNNSGGAVAVDEAGRRVFFIPATGTVRMIAADPPYAAIGDITVASMASNDCGLFFDNRANQLYVGRGGTTLPVVVSFPAMTQTAFNTGPGEVRALSFSGGVTACIDRDSDGFLPAACAPMGARADCNDGSATVNPDAAETCDGADNNCDGLVDEGFCRINGLCAANGALNPMAACEVCVAPAGMSGATAWSPRPAGTMCRAAAGVCDVPESCNGTSGQCPDDGFVASTTVCRAAVSPCDAVERCTGSTAACPQDGFRAEGEVCRPSTTVDACDPAEVCDGETPMCPNDVVSRMPALEVCGNAVDDNCNGMTDEMPCLTPDAGVVDAGPEDTGVADAGPEDTGVVDAGPEDAGPEDTGVSDVGANDDAGMATEDAALADAGIVDAGVADAGPADVGVADTGTADAGAADAAMTADAGTMADDLGGASGAQQDGCGCAVPGRSTPRAGVWGLGALALLFRRRRRSAGR